MRKRWISSYGKPEKMSKMVSYQQDAIVSKTLIKKNTGTITLFAFDEGQALSEHTVPFDACILIIEGSAQIRIASKVKHVHAGEIIILPAHKPHAVRARERFKMLLCMIKSI